ncbi:hypothetical protein ACH9EU_06340 [Kocuria sp. M1R5S2]|uniref:hypothetical protein n=1 Tax=Kocuria rhizosphaerae TaxID=3376285 RepID=UPI00378A3C77
MAPRSHADGSSSSWIASGLALGTLVVLTTLILLYLKGYQSSTSTVDQGRRALVAVTSEGSGQEYELHVHQDVDTEGQLRMVFYFTSLWGTSVSWAEEPRVDYEITFAGDPSLGGVTCGPNESLLQTASFEALSPGARASLLLDAAGGRRSALNYDGTAEDLPRAALTSDTYFQAFGTMWLSSGEARHTSRDEGADGYVWAEECRVPEEAVWHHAEGETPVTADRKTLIVPQVSWTSIGERTDHHRHLRSFLRVDRPEGVELVEAYPQPVTHDSHWTYETMGLWNNELGDVDNVGYTDLPVYILQQRELEEQRDVELMFVGAGMGVVATLAAYLASRVIGLLRSSLRRPTA